METVAGTVKRGDWRSCQQRGRDQVGWPSVCLTGKWTKTMLAIEEIAAFLCCVTGRRVREKLRCRSPESQHSPESRARRGVTSKGDWWLRS
ncbi:hypothetical protein JCGZ_19810 [Jatropha curcas]|uniref:Uncharacterized protein n=1 Tax=Jatropha curcas TaxID=180498 RepID=A0A067K6K1_JATCU|nr:hypothetical protein JCGZ_19810 [Jatropha curcas]